jgi:hypothetical protein
VRNASPVSGLCLSISALLACGATFVFVPLTFTLCSPKLIPTMRTPATTLQLPTGWCWQERCSQSTPSTLLPRLPFSFTHIGTHYLWQWSKKRVISVGSVCLCSIQMLVVSSRPLNKRRPWLDVPFACLLFYLWPCLARLVSMPFVPPVPLDI